MGGAGQTPAAVGERDIILCSLRIVKKGYLREHSSRILEYLVPGNSAAKYCTIAVVHVLYVYTHHTTLQWNYATT